MYEPQIRDLLEVALVACAPDETEPEDGVAVVPALAALARVWPEPPGPEARDTLHALCRKVAVAKRVTRNYGPAWRKLDDAQPLSSGEQQLLVAVLLGYAALPSADESNRGFALKMLNGALTAIDQADDTADLTAARAVARGLLDHLDEENAS